MTNDKTARVLKSATRWLQRRAKARTAPDTKAAYKEAIEIVSRLCAPVATKTKTPKQAPAAKTEGK
jgi:hypothetical protein